MITIISRNIFYTMPQRKHNALPGGTGNGFNSLGEKQVEEKPKLHKQPRPYLKTMSKLVGRATNEVTLFSMPDAIGSDLRDMNSREVISKNTSILGMHLIQMWQQSGEQTLKINNLSELGRIMNQTNYEIKMYLLYLGGYTYPLITNDDSGLTIAIEQIFKVAFKYNKALGEKYGQDLIGVEKVGTGAASLIKNEPVDRIEITLNKRLIEAMDGKGLGNVLVVNNDMTKLSLSLSDMAYKILTFTASNRPNGKMKEPNLIKHLGLEKQVKTQGRPRIRKTILKGFQELKENDHIERYNYNESTEMYTYKYSDRYVKHKDHLKKESK